jgi:hypothetical protein
MVDRTVGVRGEAAEPQFTDSGVVALLIRQQR